MKKIYVILLLLSVALVSGCIGRRQYETEKMYGMSPHCRKETNVAVYDKDGMHVYPGCVDYGFESYDRGFPDVPNNKYEANQVIMENLNTRVLAYCRGSEEEIESCVETLEASCYTRLSEVPYLTAKHDFLTRGTYPTRRWREGDVVPRW
jgi:hypothetical protein